LNGGFLGFICVKNGDWALKSTKMINNYIGSKNVFIFGLK